MKQVNILELDEWNTPASKYIPAQEGNHRIAKHTYQPGFYAYHGIDGYMLFCATKELRATTLLEFRPNRSGLSGWKEWMVDSPTDYRAMQKYAAAAKGDVLTSGLGLGLLVHELSKNPAVASITVIEKSPDVGKLICKYLPLSPYIAVVYSDFWEFIKTDTLKFDTIIADIWVYYGLDQQLEMYRNEIQSAYERLEQKYPHAQIVCHGFAGHPTEQQLQQLELTGDITNPLIVDPLIYGLQEKEFIYRKNAQLISTQERRLHASSIS